MHQNDHFMSKCVYFHFIFNKYIYAWYKSSLRLRHEEVLNKVIVHSGLEPYNLNKLTDKLTYCSLIKLRALFSLMIFKICDILFIQRISNLHLNDAQIYWKASWWFYPLNFQSILLINKIYDFICIATN